MIMITVKHSFVCDKCNCVATKSKCFLKHISQLQTFAKARNILSKMNFREQGIMQYPILPFKPIESSPSLSKLRKAKVAALVFKTMNHLNKYLS